VDATAVSFKSDGLKVSGRVSSEQGQTEFAASGGRPVTGSGIAPGPRQQWQNLRLKIGDFGTERPVPAAARPSESAEG